MPTISVSLSGAWRVSSTNPVLDLITRNISGVITGSTFAQQEIVVLPNVSDLVVSFPLLSSPLGILMTATNVVRVNFAGQASSPSAASASVIQFKDFAGFMVQSATLPSGIHFSNSGTDSSTVTVLIVG